MLALNVMKGFMQGLLCGSVHEICGHETATHREKELRQHLTEKQVDKMLEDSFPTSDPPSTY